MVPESCSRGDTARAYHVGSLGLIEGLYRCDVKKQRKEMARSTR